MTTIKHGASAYANGLCRCQFCTHAHRVRLKEDRAHRYALRELINGRLIATRPGLVHGTHNTYSNYGCRCEPCVERNSQECASRRARRAQRGAS